MKLRFRKYFNLKYKQISRRSKLITLLIFMILLAAAILIVNQEVINQRVYTIIGTTLQEWVYKESDGLYKFSYDSLSVNTFKEQVTLKNVHLRIDSTQLDKLEGSLPRNIYKASAPQLFIDITSIWDVLFENKLDLKNIKVHNPTLTVYNLTKRDSAVNLSFESGDLYLKLNKYLDEFNIEKFFLIGGKITYKRLVEDDRREITIDNVDAYVDNLSVDATTKTAGTDRIRVVLKKPSFMLGDGIHKIQMDSLLIDSKYEKIVLNEVFIFPDYAYLQQTNLDEINLYNFSIPNILLEGIDFSQAYQENILEIDKITIPEPEIVIDTHKQPKDSTIKEVKSNSLPILLSKLFSRITTHELIIDDAKMDFVIETSSKLRNIKIKNTSLAIKGLDLDTIKYSKRNNHINFDQISLRLDDYTLILPDSVHELVVETIIYHSDSSHLKILNAQVSPKYPVSRHDILNKFKINIPAIAFEGFDLKDYLQNHQLTLDEVRISQPVFSFYNQKSGDSVSLSDFNFILPNDKLASLVSSNNIFFDGIEFSIYKGQEKFISLSNADLTFSNFQLSTNDPGEHRMLNSTSVKFSIPSANIYDADFEYIKLFELDGQLNQPWFTLGGIQLKTSKNDWELEGKKIRVKGYDLKNLVENQNIISLDSLLIREVLFTYNEMDRGEDQAKDKTNPSSLLSLAYLYINNGQVIINDKNKRKKADINKISGSISGLELASDETKIEKLEFSTGMIEHSILKDNLKIGAMRADITNDKILFYLPYVIPLDNSMDNSISVTASQLGLIDYDLYLLINKKKLWADELKILSTSFLIENRKASAKKSQENQLYIDWQEIFDDKFNEVRLERFIVSGPELYFKTDDGQIASEEFQVELKGFNTSLDGHKNLLNAGNIRIEVNNANYKTEDISIKALKFSLDENKKLITIDNLDFNNQNNSLEIPLLFAKRLDLKKLAEEGKLIGSELELAGFKLTHGPKDKNKETPNKNKNLPRISFDKVNAHHGQINLNINNETYSINNVRGQFKNFDTETNKELPLFTSAIDIRASDFSGYLNDKNDKILISGLRLDDSGKEIHMEQLNLIPVHEKRKYAYEFGHEKDWINMVVKDITAKNFDLNSLLKDNKLLIDNVSAGQLTANIYRDKKLPFPENNKPKLPASALKALDLEVDVNTLKLNNVNLTYQELSEQAFEPGELTFSEMNIKITNITNIPSEIKIENKLSLKADGKIEGTDISATASFDLASSSDKFYLSGDIGEGNLRKFNNIMERNVFLRIEKGYSRGLNFNIQANNDEAFGKMEFYYRNLKVSLLDKQTNKTSGLDESLASFFANTFVIHSNNPSLFVLKEGTIYFKRDKSKSLFNYWAKSFLSGVVSSIGVKNNKKEAEEALNTQNEQ